MQHPSLVRCGPDRGFVCLIEWADVNSSINMGETHTEREDGERQRTMRRGPVAPLLRQRTWEHGEWTSGGADGWGHSCLCAYIHVNAHTEFRLTASMPESCMPMLTTAIVMSCQRTLRSESRPQTDTDWMEDRERCSSRISSTSAWMFSFLRYHFRAEPGQESPQPWVAGHYFLDASISNSEKNP